MDPFPRAANGTPILDHLPRNGHGCVDIDVYLRDTRTGRAVVHRSEFGNLQRDPLPVGPDWRAEPHDYFHEYWWADGNMGCDCNRQTLGDDTGGVCGDDVPELRCNSGGNVIVIDKITPAGVPDVVLYSDAERDAP